MQLCTKWCLSAINTAPVHHLWKLLSLPSALLSLLSHSAHVASCNTAMGWISHTPHWSLAVGSCTWFSESLFHWFWVLTSSSAFSSSFLGNYCGSVGKESTCNAGDPGLIPGSGRSPGEWNGNPSQYSCLENPMNRGAWQATVHGVARVGHDLATKQPPNITELNTQ